MCIKFKGANMSASVRFKFVRNVVVTALCTTTTEWEVGGVEWGLDVCGGWWSSEMHGWIPLMDNNNVMIMIQVVKHFLAYEQQVRAVITKH